MRRVLCLLSAVLLAVGLVSIATPATASPLAVTPVGTVKAASADPAGMFRPVALTRVLNTAAGLGGHQLAAGATATFPVTGLGAIPASNVAAVVIDLTVPNPTQAGTVAVFPGSTAWNGAATLSFGAGQTEQGMLTETLGSGGTLSVRNGAKVAIDLIGDVTGYYTGGTATEPGAYVGLPSSQRILNTAAKPIPAGGTLAVSGLVGGATGGIAAVAVNLTVIAPARAGSVAVYSGTWDGTPTVSLVAGHTQQRMAVEQLDGSGSFTVRNNTAAGLVIIVDAVGYYRSGSTVDPGAFQPVGQRRLFDSRTQQHTAIKPGESAYIFADYPYAGSEGAASVGTIATQFDLVVVSPTGRGAVAVYPGTSPWPGTATMSFAAGTTAVRPVTTGIGIDQGFRVRNNSTAAVTIVVEQYASFRGTASPVSAVTNRLTDSNQGNVLDLSCPATTFCAALQTNGFVTTFDGTSWGKSARLMGLSSDNEYKPDPAEGQPAAISCASASFCVVVGSRIAMYDGEGWHTLPEAPPFGLTHVSCPTATFCMAVSQNAQVLVWNGTAWSVGSSPTTTEHNGTAVSCLSSSFCMEVGSTTAQIWNGTAWGAATSLTEFMVPNTVSCISSSFCLAVGGHGRSAEWNGTAWTSVSGNPDSGAGSCTADLVCRVIDVPVGEGDPYGQVRTLAAGSTTWSAPTPLTGQLSNAISCPASNDCIVVGGDLDATAYQWDGTSWSSPVTVDPGHGYLTGVSCAAVAHCIAVDRYDWYFTYDQGGWSDPKRLPLGLHASSVSCPTTTFCAAVGSSGLAATFDGTAWSSTTTVASGEGLGKIECASANYCLAVDVNGHPGDNGDPSDYTKVGEVSVWDGTRWSALAVLPGVGGLRSTSCPAANFCMAVTDDGRSTTWDGQAWSAPVAIGLLNGLENVSCTSSTYCFAVEGQPSQQNQSEGPRDGAAAWRGSTWSPVPTGRVTIGYDSMVSCGAVDRCLIGTAYLGGWNGSTWVEEAAPSWTYDDADYSDTLSCVGPTFCAIVNADGQGAILNLNW